MKDRFSGLKLIQREMNKIRAKQIKPSVNNLHIALDDGRIIEIRTRTQEDKPMIGDPVFNEEGFLIKEGELTTATTSEKFIIENGVITEIIDTTLENEPVQSWNKSSVVGFVRKANQLLKKRVKESISPERYVLESNFKQLKQKLSLHAHSNQVNALVKDIEALRAKIQEEIQLINDSK